MRSTKTFLPFFLLVLGAATVCTAFWLFLAGWPVAKTIDRANVRSSGQGFDYNVAVEGLISPLMWVPYDSILTGNLSELVLTEGSVPLGPAHSLHEHIAKNGRGAFSHWEQSIHFSASDNSDPRTNGRVYGFKAAFYLKTKIFALAVMAGLLLALGGIFFLPAPSRLWRFWSVQAFGRVVGIFVKIAFLFSVWLGYIGFGETLTPGPQQINKGPGHSYAFAVPPPFNGRFKRLLQVQADHNTPNGSPTRLFENDRESKAGHMQHTDIFTLGSGRFSHWQESIIFSSLDNTDPRTNGRTYRVELRYVLDYRVPLFLGLVLLAILSLLARPNGQLKNLMALSAAAVAAGVALAYAGGFLMWLALGLLIGAGIATIRCELLLFFPRKISQRREALPINLTILVGTIFFCLGLGELGLVGYEFMGRWGVRLPDLKQLFANVGAPAETRASLRWSDPTGDKTKPDPSQTFSEDDRIRALLAQSSPQATAARESRRGLLALPPEWQRQTVNVEGSDYSYMWHNVLHVNNNDHFRRTTPFPEKNAGIFRIMVVGDSLTYGQGIPDSFTYPAVLERILGQEYRVEVLNLGVCGYQSEDVLDVIKNFAPELKPNLIVYGMCLNDFLPAGVGEGTPPPLEIPKFFMDRTRIGQLADQAVHALAMRYGYAQDFFGQVSAGIEEYHPRFAQDVLEMNEFNQSLDLPPIIALVLSQMPATTGPVYDLTRRAEASFRQAGFNLVDSGPYYRALNGQLFQVSPWEGHPDEVLNDLFAHLLADRIKTLESLQPFKKAS